MYNGNSWRDSERKEMGVHFRIKEKELSLEIRDRHSFVKCALTVTLFVGTSAEERGQVIPSEGC